MNDKDYIELLKKQIINSQKPGIKRYLEYLYSLIEKELVGKQILEIGAGAGLSSNFIKDKNIVLTDILAWENEKVQGLVNASDLPFNDNHFDSVFSVDAIHHMEFPVKAISEACRVVRSGGRVVIIEPYVSFFSFLIYKLFHNEQTTWNYRIASNGSGISALASEGEQATLQAILDQTEIINLIKKPVNKELRLSRIYLSPVSFFATGGLSKPLPIPAGMIALILFIEKLVPAKIMKFISARQLLIIEVC